MAKVKTAKIRFEGSIFVQEFHCSAAGEFSCAFPPAVSAAMGKHQAKGKTIQECERAWNDVMAEYREKKTSTRKVIYYSASISGTIEAGDKLLLQRKDVSFSQGLTLGLFVGIYDETIYSYADGSKRYRYSETEGENTLPRSLGCYEMTSDDPSHKGLCDDIPDGVIEWTPAREKFFADMGLAFERLVLSVADSFKDDKAVLKLVDSGRNLLPAPSKK